MVDRVHLQSPTSVSVLALSKVVTDVAATSTVSRTVQVQSTVATTLILPSNLYLEPSS